MTDRDDYTRALSQYVRDSLSHYRDEAHAAGLERGVPDQKRADVDSGKPLPLDAFRHAYTSAVVAEKWGQNTAKTLGDAYEKQANLQGTQKPQDDNMDRWNNAFGRKLAAETPAPPVKGTWLPGLGVTFDPDAIKEAKEALQKLLADKVADALRRGELITDPIRDPRKYPDDFGKLSSMGGVNTGGNTPNNPEAPGYYGGNSSKPSSQPTQRQSETPPHINKPQNPYDNPDNTELNRWRSSDTRSEPSSPKAPSSNTPAPDKSSSASPATPGASSPSFNKGGPDSSNYPGGKPGTSGAWGSGVGNAPATATNKPSASAPGNKDDDDDKAEQSRTEPAKADPAKTEAARTESSATGTKTEGGKNNGSGSDSWGSPGGTEPRDHQPVLLDLDGDGVEIAELSRSSVFMDSGGDGLLHRTAWAGAGDGVLFFDANNDGKIGEKREYVFTEWDPTATSDLEALRAAFDSNGDARLTAADTAFAQFKVLVTKDDGAMITGQAKFNRFPLIPTTFGMARARGIELPHP
jgi:hypothetical protein